MLSEESQSQSQSQIQIGMNLASGLVKVRAPDEKSDGGYIVMTLTPAGARLLAEWLTDGAAGKVLKVSDNKRWAEHHIPPYNVEKIAKDLRECANQIETPS
jgi:hypothetical protein